MMRRTRSMLTAGFSDQDDATKTVPNSQTTTSECISSDAKKLNFLDSSSGVSEQTDTARLELKRKLAVVAEPERLRDAQTSSSAEKRKRSSSARTKNIQEQNDSICSTNSNCNDTGGSDTRSSPTSSQTLASKLKTRKDNISVADDSSLTRSQYFSDSSAHSGSPLVLNSDRDLHKKDDLNILQHRVNRLRVHRVKESCVVTDEPSSLKSDKKNESRISAEKAQTKGFVKNSRSKSTKKDCDKSRVSSIGSSTEKLTSDESKENSLQEKSTEKSGGVSSQNRARNMSRFKSSGDVSTKKENVKQTLCVKNTATTAKPKNNMDELLAGLSRIRNEKPKRQAKKTVKKLDQNKDVADGKSGVVKPRKSSTNEEKEDEGSSSSDSEWEEVKDLPGDMFNSAEEDEKRLRAQIPDKPVEIVITMPDAVSKKRHGSCFDEKNFFRQLLNRTRRESQENAHQVHLLCLLAQGRNMNHICCNKTLKAVAFSLVSRVFCDQFADQWTLMTLTHFVQYFAQIFRVSADTSPSKVAVKLVNINSSMSYVDTLISRIADRVTLSEQEHILKAAQPKKTSELNAVENKANKCPSKLKKASTDLTLPQVKKNACSDSTSQPLSTLAKKPSVTANHVKVNNHSVTSKLKCSDQSEISIVKGKGVALKCEDAFRDERQKAGKMTKNDRPRRYGSKVNYAEESDDGGREGSEIVTKEEGGKEKLATRKVERLSDDEEEKEKGDREKEVILRSAPRGGEGRRGKMSQSGEVRSVKASKRSTSKDEKNSSDDEDFVISHIQRSTAKKCCKVKKEPIISDSTLSNQSNPIPTSSKTRSDWWSEVYLEHESRWIYVNSARDEVDKPKCAEKFATSPISHVLAFDNGDHIKDVTMKYASNWLSGTRKLRLTGDWWKEVLEPFQSLNAEKESYENLLIQEALLKKPMPTSISEYKGHPLYALKRHLLKFEAIYPPTAVTLGYVHGEPVYSRDCVHTLHAKEKWRLEGRLVRIDEEPYKIVKARPKWNAPKEVNDNRPLPLFGKWQTEEFIPFPAVNGIVPKNEYGNVELFQPWMLPKGTIHLEDDLPGLNKVAKKLNIDIAPAMTGWEFHGGFNHPIHEGWVVCEEHREILLTAWKEEQSIRKEKEREKKSQHACDNWKTLTRGLLIKERLKKRFDLQERVPNASQTDALGINEDDDERNTAVPDVALCWPQNLKGRKEKESTRSKTADQQNLFPFEIAHNITDKK